jgi:hypothetical protein
MVRPNDGGYRAISVRVVEQGADQGLLRVNGEVERRLPLFRRELLCFMQARESALSCHARPRMAGSTKALRKAL